MRDASILEILGLEHNEKFVQALIALQRHAKESQKKTSTAELLAALNKVVTAKSRFPRWKTDLEPIEKELLQLVEATRRIARMPAQAIKINPLESSSNSNSSLCMEKQNAVPKLQFETMGPISEIEMVDASLGVLGWSSWLEFLAGVLGWSSWLEFLAGVLGWSSWLEFLAGVLGWSSWSWHAGWYYTSRRRFPCFYPSSFCLGVSYPSSFCF
jgi:hypothetical protein